MYQRRHEAGRVGSPAGSCKDDSLLSLVLPIDLHGAGVERVEREHEQISTIQCTERVRDRGLALIPHRMPQHQPTAAQDIAEAIAKNCGSTIIQRTTERL